MRSFTSDALILDVFDLHEQDRIVTFLTPREGKKKGVARGARRKYSRFAGELQPLARVRVRWFEKEGRELVRIGDVDLVRPAHRLQQDLDGILVGSYLAEHMTVFAQEGEDSELAFRLLDSTLEALLGGVDRDLAARFYEAWVLRLAGIFPAPTECPACGRDLVDGAVLPPGEDFLLCEPCAAQSGGGRGLEVPAPVLEFLVRIGRERLTALAVSPPPSRVLRRAEALAVRVRRRFLDRDLKSYDMIQKLSS